MVMFWSWDCLLVRPDGGPLSSSIDLCLLLAILPSV